MVLTFDDGPTPGETDDVLRALAVHDARATFFVLVNRAAQSPALLREVIAAGHEIALHGPDHRRLTDFTAAEVAQRTADSRSRLEDLAQVEVRWFRPPYGRQGLSHWRSVRELGLETAMWGPTLRDWESVPHEERLAGALAECRRGSIVLGHDGFAGRDDGVDDGPDPQVDRFRLVDGLLRGLEDRDLRATSLEQAAALGEVRRTPWFRL
ncbi:hypothetical protein GCM10027425_02960 [Alteromonas gracilis]